MLWDLYWKLVGMAAHGLAFVLFPFIMFGHAIGEMFPNVGN